MDTPRSEWNIKTSFSPGTLIAGRFEIRQKIGAGGMGVVLRALDRKLGGEEVALKILRPQLGDDDPLALPRLINEVRLARALTHPNIVRIHDIGETDDGAAYISMEFIAGGSLGDLIADPTKTKRGLSIDEAYHFLLEIARGVAYAHTKGIIHRDLKPANILITKNKEVKIADFGIARTIDNELALTRTGEAVGTPAYMAPEQFRGEALDARCDVYALGILAHQMLTGELPFASKSFFNIALQHMNDELPPLSQFGVKAPDWFEAIIFKAASKEKNRRYASAKELADALEQCSANFKRSMFGKRAPQAAAGAGAALCLAAIGFATLHKPGSVTPHLPPLSRPLLEPMSNPVQAPIENRVQPVNGGADRHEAEAELKTFAKPVTAEPPRESVEAARGSEELRPLDRRQLSAARREDARREDARGHDAQGEPEDRVEQGAPPVQRAVQPRLKEATRPGGERLAADAPPGPFANLNPPSAARPAQIGKQTSYQGSIFLGGPGSGKTMILKVVRSGENVDGSAVVTDVGKFSVSGTIAANGVKLRLSGRGLSLVLTGSNRSGQLSGQFSIPSQDGKTGRWNATLIDD